MPVDDLQSFGGFLELEVVAFFLVLARMSGLVLFGPVLSSRAMPRLFRFFLAFALALLVQAGMRPRVAIAPATIADAGVAVFGEILIGLVLGTCLQMMFQALQLAGQNSGNQLGIALANVLNPQFEEQISTTAVIYVTVASLIFLAGGLDRQMVAALLETIDAIPLGGVVFSGDTLDILLRVFQQSMVFALRVTAPVTVALLLTEVAMAFVSRTVPQLNVQSVGFTLRIPIGILVTATSLTAVALLFVDELRDALAFAYRALANLAG